jgi:uncharacterized membrane protein
MPSLMSLAMIYGLSYVAALAVFVAIDAVWLSTMANVLYRNTLGDILLDSMRLAPAAVFYLVYPVGILIFAAMPGLKAESIGVAVLYGALFGVFTYATYDLTNFATLRNWTLTITVLDILYGAIASSLAAAAAYSAARALSS